VNDQLLQLSERIRNELAELQRVLRRAEEGWKRAQQSAADYYLDGVTLNLHGFYNGLERSRRAVIVYPSPSRTASFCRIAGATDVKRDFRP